MHSSLSPFCCFQGDVAGVQSWATLLLTQELYSCSQVSLELSILTGSQLPTSPTSLALQGPTPPPFLLGTALASTGHSRLSLGEVISFQDPALASPLLKVLSLSGSLHLPYVMLPL